jgi:hypothetical protein
MKQDFRLFFFFGTTVAHCVGLHGAAENEATVEKQLSTFVSACRARSRESRQSNGLKMTGVLAGDPHEEEDSRKAFLLCPQSTLAHLRRLLSPGMLQLGRPHMCIEKSSKG